MKSLKKTEYLMNNSRKCPTWITCLTILESILSPWCRSPNYSKSEKYIWNSVKMYTLLWIKSPVNINNLQFKFPPKSFKYLQQGKWNSGLGVKFLLGARKTRKSYVYTYIYIHCIFNTCRLHRTKNLPVIIKFDTFS